MRKQKLSLLLLLAIVFALGGSLVASAQSSRQVWAFYMGFWLGPASWDQQGDVLSDRPLIGGYDSRDPGVMATQIDQAKSAGIDAFTISWYGPSNAETTAVLNNGLDRAGERGFKVAAVIDAFGGGIGRDGLDAAIRYLAYDRANHPAYLRYNGKPVILFAFQENLGLSTQEWLNLRNAIDPDRNTIWISEGINGCCMHSGAFDGMYAFNLAWNNGNSARYSSERSRVLGAGGEVYAATIHPGWDENLIAAREGRPNPTSPKARNDGQFLRNTFNGAAASGTDVMMIVSWNEFIENSHIEPSTTYGNQSLDTLRSLVAGWKGNAPAVDDASPSPSSEPTGRVAEATTTLNVRAGAGTSFAILGKINPGTRYSVTGEQPGWVTINYNGQTGYVSASYVSVTGGEPTSPEPPADSGSSDGTSSGASTGTVAEATTTLNVRAGAGTSFRILGKISPGAQYAVYSVNNGWVNIDYNGQSAYVSQNYVNISSGAPGVGSAPGEASGATMQFIYNTNMRTVPSGDLIMTIPANTTVAVVGRNGDSSWILVNYNGRSGWVAAYLGNLSVSADSLPIK